jgi:hypothetical protein
MRVAGAIIVSSIGIALLAGPAAGSPPTGPSHCDSKAIRSTLVSFTAALNRGDLDALDELFAEKPDFQWYSTEWRTGRAAKRRDTLIPYFRRRHEIGERLRLAASRLNGNSPHYGNFEMLMGRRVPSFAGGVWLPVLGKGAAICHAGSTRLIVMSFGRVVRPRARS